MAMTLKLTPHSCRAHDPGPTTSWIGGVTEVHRLAQAYRSEYLDKWEIYFRGDGIRNLADQGPPAEGDGDPFYTLLSVRCGDENSFYVSAQTAWLLSESGDTIERIAP